MPHAIISPLHDNTTVPRYNVTAMCLQNRPEDTEAATVDFGFTEVAVPPGTHVCQIYEDDDERTDAFVRFLLKGLQLRELSAGFSDVLKEADFTPYLTDEYESGALQLSRSSEAYFSNNRFDPDHMLDFLTQFHKRSRGPGYTGGRVIGEMTPEIRESEGAERLLEYEARVNMLLRDHPMTVMCQYNARSFSGSTLMDVLKAHALMVIRGTIVSNPFYVPPETLLGKR